MNDATNKADTITNLIEWALVCSKKGKHRQCFGFLAAAYISTNDMCESDREETKLYINDVFTPCQDRAYADGMLRESCTDMFIDELQKLRAAA